MLTLTHILCPTDFSKVSIRAETNATALASHYGAGLHLLHVSAPVPVVAPYGEIPVDVRFFETQREEAREALALARERARAAGVAAESVEHSGQPAREILATAEKLHSDLIVLGTHGRGGFEHMLLGSVAEKVLRKATCPVMVVPEAAPTDAGVQFSRILCPIDGSAASRDAVAFAVSLARETDGCITLMQAVEPVPPIGDFGALDTEEYRRLAAAGAAQSLREAVPADVREWCRTEDVVAFGKASVCILDTAKTTSADVIVMGVRGRGAIDLAAFGSTTNEVVRRASCPVVAVHPTVTDKRHLAPSPTAVVV
jgi:nucleotide-binding universal stress UspA family protein